MTREAWKLPGEIRGSRERGEELINENPVSQKEKQERLMIDGGERGGGREKREGGRQRQRDR